MLFMLSYSIFHVYILQSKKDDANESWYSIRTSEESWAIPTVDENASTYIYVHGFGYGGDTQMCRVVLEPSLFRQL